MSPERRARAEPLDAAQTHQGARVFDLTEMTRRVLEEV